MTYKEWFINPWSKYITSNHGLTIIRTGKWYDIWYGPVHMTGTMQLNAALKILGLTNAEINAFISSQTTQRELWT